MMITVLTLGTPGVHVSHFEKSLRPGSLTPGLRTTSHSWSVRNWAGQQEVSSKQASKHYPLNSDYCHSSATLDSHRTANLILNCISEGSRLCAFYKTN